MTWKILLSDIFMETLQTDDKYSMTNNKRQLTSLFDKEQDTDPIVQSKVSKAL